MTVTKDQDLSQLPRGWARIVLGDYIHIAGRIGWKGLKKSEYLSDGPLLLAVKDILENGAINYGVTDHLSEFRYEESPEIQLKNQDVLITKDGTIGKVGFVENLPEKTTVNSSILVVRPSSAIFPKFLFYYFKGPKFQDIVRKKIMGTAVPHLFQHDIKRFQLDISPLPEQRRIVAKVEELFTNLDAGVESLKKVKTQLKRYLQAVLKHAFEGKLTEEWRKTHKDQIEPARELLERIKQESKKKTRVRYEEPSVADTSSLPELPEGWVWTKSGNLSWFVTSGSRDWKKYYSNSGPFFIRTENINTNKLSLDNVAHVSLPEKVEGKRSLVEKNDILIIITGANVGKVALVNQEIGEAYVSQSVALMKLVMPEIARFVHFAMIAEGFGKTELSRMVYGMGRPVLSLKNVQEITLPLAPLLEQEKIVEEIERRLSVADEIEKTIEQRLRQSELLRQSILKRAFEGKLMPQDPTDEPAEKLLIRIKEARMRREVVMFKKKNQSKQLELIRYVK